MGASEDVLGVQFDRSGRQLTVYLDGELDLTSAPAFADAVIEECGDDVSSLTLDVSTLTFCDSAGLAAIVRIQEEAAAQGKKLILYQPGPLLRRLLAVTKVDSVVDIRS
ncbi:MAG TPA: STAS domain-containing protein [Aquihabitans sp.]|jgi:anti-sigma B factor antagonist|nr:STAS domain-containing protein [Aquihabitans sp.]